MDCAMIGDQKERYNITTDLNVSQIHTRRNWTAGTLEGMECQCSSILIYQLIYHRFERELSS